MSEHLFSDAVGSAIRAEAKGGREREWDGRDGSRDGGVEKVKSKQQESAGLVDSCTRHLLKRMEAVRGIPALG